MIAHGLSDNNVIDYEFEIRKKYIDPSATEKADGAYMAALYVENDISLLVKLGIAGTVDEAISILKSAGNEEIYNYVKSCISVERAVRGGIIRKDFAEAFRHVKYGTQLSRDLGWGFSDEDLVQLAKLHKSGKFRKKIEDLLTDCNFHTECDAMMNRDYSQWIK